MDFQIFFLKIILQVNKWQVEFGKFSEIPPYLYPPLFLPGTILPSINTQTKVTLNSFLMG